MACKSSRTAAGRGDVGGIRRGHETRAFSDDETGARTTRSAALGRSNDVLAARRSLAVVVSAQESRRGGWQSSRTAAGRGDVGGIRRGHETRAFSDDETGARTTRSAALGRSNDVLAARRSLAVAVSAQESRRGGWQSSRTAAGRGDVGGIRRGHETRAFSDDETGARTTRSAALGRSNDVLAARRSLAVVVSAREPARWLARAAERPQGAVASAEFGGVTRPARFPTTRPAHARRGRRRSVAATTCSRRGARSPSSCRLESRRGGWQSSRTAAGRGDVGGIRRGHETRAFSDDETGARTTRSAALGRSNDVLAARRSLAVVVSAREPARWLARAAERPQGAVASAEFGGVTRPARFPTTRPAHARRGRRRSVAATTCSRRGARSPSSCRLESRRGGWQEQQNGRRAR